MCRYPDSNSYTFSISIHIALTIMILNCGANCKNEVHRYSGFPIFHFTLSMHLLEEYGKNVQYTTCIYQNPQSAVCNWITKITWIQDLVQFYMRIQDTGYKFYGLISLTQRRKYFWINGNLESDCFVSDSVNVQSHIIYAAFLAANLSIYNSTLSTKKRGIQSKQHQAVSVTSDAFKVFNDMLWVHNMILIKKFGANIASISAPHL